MVHTFDATSTTIIKDEEMHRDIDALIEKIKEQEAKVKREAKHRDALIRFLKNEIHYPRDLIRTRTGIPAPVLSTITDKDDFNPIEDRKYVEKVARNV